MRKKGMTARRKTPSFAGIDIAPDSVSLVELSQQACGLQLIDYAVEPLPEGVVVENTIRDAALAGHALRRAVHSAGYRRKEVATAIAATQVFSKVVPLQGNLTPAEMDDWIQMEAPGHIPFPLHEVYLDYQWLETGVDDSGGPGIFLAACRKDLVETIQEVAKKAGLVLRMVNIDTCSIESLLRYQAGEANEGDEKHTLGILDLGRSRMRLNVVRDQRTVYDREQALALNGELPLTPSGAAGIPGPRDSGQLQHLAEEAVRLLQMYFSSGSPMEIDRILLTGLVSPFTGVPEIIQHVSGIPTSIANPFTGFRLSSHIDRGRLQVDAARLAFATGNALLGFDI